MDVDLCDGTNKRYSDTFSDSFLIRLITCNKLCFYRLCRLGRRIQELVGTTGVLLCVLYWVSNCNLEKPHHKAAARSGFLQLFQKPSKCF